MYSKIAQGYFGESSLIHCVYVCGCIVVQNISKAVKYYVNESHDHLQKKGFHHDSNNEQFFVTLEVTHMCVRIFMVASKKLMCCNCNCGLVICTYL